VVAAASVAALVVATLVVVTVTRSPADPNLDPTKVVAVIPPRQPFGWGAAQPTNMAATVMYGTSSKPLSPARRDLLASQLVRIRAAGMAVGTVAVAEREGFVKNFQRIDGRGYEYINWSRFTHKLDLDKPTMLLMDGDKPDSKVISVAYNVLGTREGGPPTELPLEAIPWHFHSDLCRKGNSIVGNVETGPDGKVYARHIKRCEELGATFEPQLNHWMVDFWVMPGWENPWGLVSSKHPDMYKVPQPWFPNAAQAQAVAASQHQH
jgi:hypothetical protein